MNAAHAWYMKTTPRQNVQELRANPELVPGDDERFSGFGVIGIPYASGDYLALREMVASSIGPAYRALWHRDPQGRWMIYTTAEPWLSCPRYFGSSGGSERVEEISIEFTTDWQLHVSMGDRISWTLNLASTSASRMMSAMGSVMPLWAWNSRAVLAAMNPMATVALGAGKMRLAGLTPNGPGYRAAPLRVWQVFDAPASLDGVDLGPTGALKTQVKLGDFWLPQRGLFFTGNARFENESSSALHTTAGELQGREP